LGKRAAISSLWGLTGPRASGWLTSSHSKNFCAKSALPVCEGWKPSVGSAIAIEEGRDKERRRGRRRRKREDQTVEKQGVYMQLTT